MSIARKIPPTAFFALTLLCLFSFAACVESSIMPGDVASVNGQGISFREVEARRASLFAHRSPGSEGQLDDATLQTQYRYIVAEIIREFLISQFMRDKGLAVAPELVEAEEQRIRNDYPEGAFEEMLLEEGISLDLWRENIRRRLEMERFLTQVLRPEISITSDEVQQYYHEHSADFIIPEQWHFMQITGLEKKDVERAQVAFIAGKNATAVQKGFLVTIHDIRMGKDLLPEDVNRELAGLGLWQGSKIKSHEGLFRTFVLMEKAPATMLDAATMSVRVEQALAEEKMRDAYAAWMKKRIAKADIQIAPALAEPLPVKESSPPHSSESAPGRAKTNGAAIPPAEPEGASSAIPPAEPEGASFTPAAPHAKKAEPGETQPSGSEGR